MLPFHRKRPAYEATTKKMLKYCGDEVDPKSRTLLDFHPVEVARQMALVARADFCARAAERAVVARLFATFDARQDLDLLNCSRTPGGGQSEAQ